MPTLDLRQSRYGRQTAVLHQGQWDRVQGGGEGSHRVLLDRRDLETRLELSKTLAEIGAGYLIGGLGYGY